MLNYSTTIDKDLLLLFFLQLLQNSLALIFNDY